MTFDTTRTSVAAIVAELERLTDYSATEREGAAAETMQHEEGSGTER